MSSKILASSVQKLTPSDNLIANKTVQELLGVRATTVHKLVKSGLLTPIRFSKRLVRYRASEVAALIESAAKNGGVL
jgi:predicted DNA-binding transcriptional regulator AlpA